MPLKNGKPLFERNRDAFRKRQPAAWAILEKIGNTASSPLFEDGAPVNIDLGKAQLYSLPAREWTKQQLDQYFHDPDRIGFSDPTHCNISSVSESVLFDLTHYLTEQGIEKGETYPVVDIGYAFVFGVGLGFHVPELVARNTCRYLVLIEPIPEFIIHSMIAIDWEEVFSDADEKGITIHFVMHESSSAIYREIDLLIRNLGNTFIDGSHAYMHYASQALNESRVLLNDNIMNHYLSSGFFEDEKIMMRNALGNLSKWPFFLVNGAPRQEWSIPVFIIGSGPSLDRDMPHIKKWRDRVIICSCGSALSILLKNGIRPDLHMESENTKESARVFKEWSDTYGLQGITLVASATLAPEASGYFEKRWFYFRTNLSSSVLLAGSNDLLANADPLVSNASFAVLTSLGFGNVYLFGVDCGRREGGAHHARDALYYDEDNVLPVDEIDGYMCREVPGNFGGKFISSWSLDMSRAMFKERQLDSMANLFNCSDGALIEGAEPKQASTIALADPPDQREKVLARLEHQMTFYQAGEYQEELKLEREIGASKEFIESINEFIDASIREDQGFWELEQSLKKFFIKKYSKFKGVLEIVNASCLSILRLGAFFGTRISDEKARKDFFQFFMGRFRNSFVLMVEEVEELYRELTDERANNNQVKN